MVTTILSSPLFVEIILPFLLVFTVMFAILQKTKVLGDGKRQIDAIVALVVGLLVVSFGFATGVIVSLVPFLAVSAIVILVFMILYGMVFQSGEFKMHKRIQGTIGILAAIGVIIAVMVATGAWDYVAESYFYNGDNDGLITNIIFIVIIIAVVGFLWMGSGEKKEK